MIKSHDYKHREVITEVRVVSGVDVEFTEKVKEIRNKGYVPATYSQEPSGEWMGGESIRYSQAFEKYEDQRGFLEEHLLLLWKILYLRRVKTIKCENYFAWHREKIGEIYEVKKIKDDTYQYMTTAPYQRKYLKKEEVKIVRWML